jgi:psp operon transcriptional activator
MTAEGRFKRDLLDRLSFEVLFLPSLRERMGDILLLANHFAARMAFELGRQEVPEFSDEAVTALERYRWPGNVRELKNVVERAVYRSDSALITDILFDPFRPSYGEVLTIDTEANEEPAALVKAHPAPVEKSFSSTVLALEIKLLKSALETAQFNQRKAARILGLTYHQFRGLYRKHKGQL